MKRDAQHGFNLTRLAAKKIDELWETLLSQTQNPTRQRDVGGLPTPRVLVKVKLRFPFFARQK
jgi:hypothetical protein